MIRHEERQLERLKHKSRRLRLNNPHGTRKSWYVDRMQEVDLVIRFLEGRIDEQKFIHYLLDDEAGALCCAAGDLYHG
jgi:hypothetical protein